MKRTIIAVSIAALALCCGIGVIINAGKDSDPQAPASKAPAVATSAAPSVPAGPYSATATFPAGRYADQVRISIDAQVAAKDCKALQAAFDTATANDAAQRTRTGSGTADLMTYIDGALKFAHCY